MSDYDVINESLDDEVRYCKKCGCELMSTNEGTLCENCKRRRASNVKKIGGTVLGIAGSAALGAIITRKDKS